MNKTLSLLSLIVAVNYIINYIYYKLCAILMTDLMYHVEE